ncbi:hypothetical protein [Pontibacter diazotrophicus]|uniref:hypothetical protein n=1 Tax=Pontibacter diazotrophicus TaxID=1400979 RepID=UPI0011C08078|nr:hypothetical protein [Pontibacter diazotrophicus]
MEAGGTVVAIGASPNLAYHLRLPVHNALVEMTCTGQERPLPAKKYCIPGSIVPCLTSALVLSRTAA